MRDGRIVSAHQEKEWAEAEMKSWWLYGPMVVDLDAPPKPSASNSTFTFKPCDAFVLKPGDRGGDRGLACARCSFSPASHE